MVEGNADQKSPENWKSPQKILVILAHPDDPEFFCGATIARWTQIGHTVEYCLLTRGDKGVRGEVVDREALMHLREEEQIQAAKVLGVSRVRFLDFEDGYLQADLAARREVVAVLREVRPDVVVTSDPTNFFHREDRINHPDHRIAGQIVCEAVYPASGNPLYYPELLEKGLLPHEVRELWLTLTAQPNMMIDVTDTWELKIMALKHHRSQIANMEEMERMQRQRRIPESSEDNPRYVDSFRRIKFR
ncbi:MAG: GlcNAc-PI de-N-acetylase [Bellilinea sp.]|nr:MAG: GlcNAc-PI de-N-acetylase [Bellilinea sp.]